MQTLRFFATFVALMTASTSFGQAGAPTAASAVKESDEVFIRPFFSIPLLSLEVEQNGGDGDSAARGDYSPNVQPNVGLSVDYRGLSVALSAPLPGGGSSDEEGDQKETKTQYHDYQFAYFRDYWGLEFGWHRYKGFDGNFGDDDGSGTKDDIPRPDLLSEGRYIDLTFIPFGNDLEFSKGIQDSGKTGFNWSPVVQLGYDFQRINSDQPLVPKEFALAGNVSSEITGGAAESGVLAVGGGAKYRKETWQATMIMLFGRTIERQVIAADVGERSHRTRMGERIGMRVGTNYLYGRWVYGVEMAFDETTMHFSDLAITSRVGSIVASVGTNLGQVGG